MDRQEQIGRHIVGRSYALEEAGPRLAFRQQQPRLGKAFGLQFLLDLPRKAPIEDELGDVAGADRAFRFGGMADIHNDPEFRGSHFVVTGFKVERFKPAGDSAASLIVWRLGEAAGLAKLAGFGEATRFDDLPCFDGLLKISDNQPAWPASIGRSTNAAIAATMVPRRRQTPRRERANFLPDDSNPGSPEQFLFAPHDSIRQQVLTSIPLPRLDLVEFGKRLFEFGIE